MTSTMKFTIPITPTAQKRDRIGTVAFRNGPTRAMSFKDGTQRSRENTIKAFLAGKQPPVPLQGPLLLGVRVYCTPPKGKPQWFDGSAAEFRQAVLAGVLRPPVKPDLDNFVKQIQDCLTGCEFWGDDCQVVGYLPGTGKYYTTDRARWEIEIVPYDWRRGMPLLQRAVPLLEEA